MEDTFSKQSPPSSSRSSGPSGTRSLQGAAICGVEASLIFVVFAFYLWINVYALCSALMFGVYASAVFLPATYWCCGGSRFSVAFMYM